MIIYVFDGSFEGLLTAIYEAYYRKVCPEQIISQQQNLKNNLFADYHIIATEHEKAEKVFYSIKTKISYQALTNIYYTYLSELPDCGTWIYNYLKLGWKLGNKIDSLLTNEHVLSIHSTAQKVSKERHRMLGLIRFRNLRDDIYYAPIEPNYNIVGLVAPHFASRFSEQSWVIHDLRRNLAAIYNQKEWFVSEISLESQEIVPNNKEAAYQQLWKRYFDSIAISNRLNPKLQKSLMPVRYWKHLIEK